jgi:hypothetical protein
MHDETRCSGTSLIGASSYHILGFDVKTPAESVGVFVAKEEMMK